MYCQGYSDIQIKPNKILKTLKAQHNIRVRIHHCYLQYFLWWYGLTDIFKARPQGALTFLTLLIPV